MINGFWVLVSVVITCARRSTRSFCKYPNENKVCILPITAMDRMKAVNRGSVKRDKATLISTIKAGNQRKEKRGAMVTVKPKL